ncbi:unnamed protein product, partial [Adineta ricciae]
ALGIAVENRTCVISLINALNNLQALTIVSLDDNWNSASVSDNDELVRWFQTQLPSAYVMRRNTSMSDVSSIITLLQNFFIHLRLKFSLFLAPIYLYGIIVANRNIFTWEFFVEFVILHVFVYGGVYALNDYYDRDEQGPIGGLENPPAMRGDTLFYLAWAWKLIGLTLSIFYSASTQFIVSCFLDVLMSVAYSHPKIRLKGSPFGSVLLVIFLQGFLTYYLGTILNNSNLNGISLVKFWLGAFVIIFLVLGTYPLTQVYQIEQDKRQGDCTLAIVFGIEKTFQFASLCLFVSGTLNSLVIGYYYHWWEGVIILIGSLLFQYDLRTWRKIFSKQSVNENFQTLHRLFSVQTVFPFVFCLAHLLHIL